MSVLTNEHLVTEISEVLSRTKFKKYLKRSDIEEVVALHLKLCRFVSTEETIPLLTDPKDDFLISLYTTGEATILVTGDKELLHEATSLKCAVMTLKDFEAI